MILNAFSVLAAFATFLRIGLGLVVVWVGVAALRRRAEADTHADRRFHLLFLLSATLLAVGFLSWPLFYLVLASYVSEWPGVMCIQGVTRIGADSVGPASYLPGLVHALEVWKPAMVFVAGAWLTLHLADRSSRAGALRVRTLAVLLVFGLVAVADGATEFAYLVTPKQERTLATGCCTASTAAAVSTTPVALAAQAQAPEDGDAVLTTAFFAVGIALLVALSAAMRRLERGRGAGPWLATSLVGAVAALTLGAGFLGPVAAPAFLRLPYHQCAYCLVALAPESLVGIVLFLLGVFGVGWACVAGWLGRSSDSAAGEALCLVLLRAARFGYVAALLMMASRLAIS